MFVHVRIYNTVNLMSLKRPKDDASYAEDGSIPLTSITEPLSSHFLRNQNIFPNTKRLMPTETTIAIKKLERQSAIVQWISIILSTCAIIISLGLIIF